uniref:Reverse transcriptase domain-containing protein n=1 Tax=Haemonchus contortus TaxID=6289 RepID=A0A7I4XYX2_HAECO
MLRELYNNFTTRISPFYKEVIINVKRGVRQGDTISSKLFSAALENVMRHMEWESMGVKVDGRYLHHLRFADDIVLITPNIEQAEQMLAEFDNACGKIGLRLNLTKTMFMRNGLVPDAPFMLNGTNISECSSYVYLGREVNMMNDLAPELSRRKRAAWGAFKNIEGVVKKTKNIRLRAHLFDTVVLPALTYASETWTLRKQDEHAVSVIQRVVERTMLGISLYTQVQKGIRSSELVDERRSGMPLITPRDRRSGGPDTLCDIMMTVGPERLRTGSLGTSGDQDGHQWARLLHESSERKECLAPCPSSECDSLDYSGSRQGQMETLLAPAQGNRRSTGVQVIQVIYIYIVIGTNIDIYSFLWCICQKDQETSEEVANFHLNA